MRNESFIDTAIVVGNNLPDGTVILQEPFPYSIRFDRDGYLCFVYDPKEWDRIAKNAVIIKNLLPGEDDEEED